MPFSAVGRDKNGWARVHLHTANDDDENNYDDDDEITASFKKLLGCTVDQIWIG